MTHLLLLDYYLSNHIFSNGNDKYHVTTNTFNKGMDDIAARINNYKIRLNEYNVRKAHYLDQKTNSIEEFFETIAATLNTT
jgi:hypothetical protein